MLQNTDFTPKKIEYQKISKEFNQVWSNLINVDQIGSNFSLCFFDFGELIFYPYIFSLDFSEVSRFADFFSPLNFGEEFFFTHIFSLWIFLRWVSLLNFFSLRFWWGNFFTHIFSLWILLRWVILPNFFSLRFWWGFFYWYIFSLNFLRWVSFLIFS